MVIDIDIKIADGNGKLLHRFERSFDESTVSTNQGETISDLGKCFEDFLSEYMSISGRMIREKLIGEYTNTVFDQYSFEDSGNDEIQIDCDDLKNLSDTEMEYKIRLGSKKILIGKIPLHYNKSTKIETDKQNDNIVLMDRKLDDGYKSSVNNIKYKRNSNRPLNELDRNFNPTLIKREKSDLDTILNYAMSKAIEKYEVNLSAVINETNLVAIEP